LITVPQIKAIRSAASRQARGGQLALLCIAGRRGEDPLERGNAIGQVIEAGREQLLGPMPALSRTAEPGVGHFALLGTNLPRVRFSIAAVPTF
jgi:hypothetical protein